jgi:hypothetical protein
MRFPAAAWTAVAFTAGCLRFGYGAAPSKLDSGFDSGIAGTDGSVSGPDPATDSGSGMDSGGMDAAISGETAGADASDGPADGGGSSSGASDAGALMDSGANDAGMISVMMDSGTVDSGTRDSGTTDSGTTDSGTTTSEVDPRWTEDCPGVPSILFCDDFEDSLVKWSYPVHVRGSTAVTTDYKRMGSYALRASTSASTATEQSQARRGVRAYGGRKSGDLWARYYYYLPSSVTLSNRFSSGVISEYADPFFGFSLMIYPDGVGIESGAISRKTTTTTFPRDQWVCVEMHVQIHASAGLFEFYMNGSPAIALKNLDTLPEQGYTSFEIGVHYAPFNEGAITVYADDVKLGTSRVGCN